MGAHLFDGPLQREADGHRHVCDVVLVQTQADLAASEHAGLSCLACHPDANDHPLTGYKMPSGLAPGLESAVNFETSSLTYGIGGRLYSTVYHTKI